MEVSVFHGAMARDPAGDFEGSLPGDQANCTFDASSPGVTSIGTLEGVTDGASLGGTDGTLLGGTNGRVVG